MLQYTFLVLITGYFFGNVNSGNINKIKIPKCCSENQAPNINDDFETECTDFPSSIELYAKMPVYDDRDTTNIENIFNDIFSLQSDMKPDAELVKGFLPNSDVYLFKVCI